MDKYVNKKLVERFKQLIKKERFQNPPVEQIKFGSFDYDIKNNSISFYNIKRIDEIKNTTSNNNILKKIEKYEKAKSKNDIPNTLSFREKRTAKKVFKINDRINNNTSRSKYLFEHNKGDVLKNKYKEYKEINNSPNKTILNTINNIISFSFLILFILYFFIYKLIFATNNSELNYTFIIIFFIIFLILNFIMYIVKNIKLDESNEKFIKDYLINLNDLSENGDIYTRMSENHIDYNEINNYMNYKRSAPIKINLFKDEYSNPEDIKIEKIDNEKSSNIGINIFHLIINILFSIFLIFYMISKRNTPEQPVQTVRDITIGGSINKKNKNKNNKNKNNKNKK